MAAVTGRFGSERLAPFGRPGRATPITILMYHGVRPGARQPGDTYTVTPEAFARQIAFVRSRYPVVPIEDVPGLLASGGDDLRRRVVVTFDDGEADFVRFAYPILQAQQVPATMFVATRFLTDPACMPGDVLRRLAAERLVHIGSHSVNHVPMHGLSREQIVHELRDSKRELEALLGAPVRIFAYPFGRRSIRAGLMRQLLQDAGYDLAVTCAWGTCDAAASAFDLRRIYLESDDDEQAIEAKIDGRHVWRALKASVGVVTRGGFALAAATLGPHLARHATHATHATRLLLHLR